MPNSQLPSSYRWSGNDRLWLELDGVPVAHVSVATYNHPAMVSLMWGDRTINAVHAGSVGQARRFVERWIAVRRGSPLESEEARRHEADMRHAVPGMKRAIDRSMKR
ncbi:hypothetical protein WCN79_15210 [Xanthomonas axonopodis pv. vasculorum]|uniref:Uncharacterized protein n=1 Tax=Xanthomonas axonopodis pv. vasculorum TaxID=325777 RepID=A0A098Q0W1_9XANT|nr:hypothetical protein [Xanthomonas axonopodis]KGE52636.1 hypothetical protein GW15_0206725 [Xanthomonas axonopodis pv. vasculorum]PPV10457.1 hypothetical protein XavaCFBP5823_08695 [Xanthomonas axonopodis pv. vasculorum]QKD86358.1 hypothetical protein XAV_08065 [Xanthomonas axonopodis pv. vasculorum]